MIENNTGVCIYCGQILNIDVSDKNSESEAERNKIATRCCNCKDAERAAHIEDQIENGQERIQQLFGEGAEELDFIPLKNEKSIV